MKRGERPEHQRWAYDEDMHRKTLFGLIRLRAYKHCDPLVRPYVECARASHVITPWRCSNELKRMKTCIHLFDEAHRPEIEEEFWNSTPEQKEEWNKLVRKKT